MVRNEYIRFMQTLLASDVPDNVRKLANIVLLHIDEIIPLGTVHGKRSQKLVQILQQEIVSASATITGTPNLSQKDQQIVARLKSLRVGPFRGFAKEETFDLDSPIVLIYGPNGSGKSSFCEALEYGLLGSVKAAEDKRFSPFNDFLKNAHTRHFRHPTIEAITPAGNTQLINANEALFRFCFVEKTRIDNFSHIAAHTPARQTDLISTLLGLDAFNNFVKNFSSSLDAKYIDLTGLRTSELNIKRIEIEGHRQTIKFNTMELDLLAQEEQALAESYQKGIIFSEFVIALGDSERPGEIQRIEKEIEKPAPVSTGMKAGDLEKFMTNTEELISKLLKIEDSLARSSEGLSYKKLYQAVLELSSASRESCPACKTPLYSVTENPFQRAANGLSELAHLAKLEQERDALNINLQKSFKNVHEKLEIACAWLQGQTEQTDVDQQLRALVVDSDEKLNVSWWNKLTQVQTHGESAWLILKHQAKMIEAVDASISDVLTDLARQKDRLKALRELSNKAISYKSQRMTLENAITRAKKAIVSFEQCNQSLIDSAEAETAIVHQNREIADSYTQFVRLLNSYMESLPEKMLSDLGSKIVCIYNAFNRTDSPGDLLSSLKLPTTSGERIEISFINSSDKFFDALHVLSEGHIRCLGLSILLAKNLKDGCPLLIFDDPVNAIDDDHRESIRRTLFEDDYFKDKQIILTCHGEEFYKDIQNLLGADRTKIAKRFTFLPQFGDKHIQFDSGSKPRNYILAAQEHLAKLEIRDALASARRALEVLSRQVWQYVSKNGDGTLSIKMRSASSPIELRNLAEQLRKQLSDIGFSHPRKDKILRPINTLLGLNGDSREWRYLNRGTHEDFDRAEFDRDTVAQIINELACLDRQLNGT